ncbi:tyrosinase central domain protein [Neofusicoccum parvum]|uniref:Tyrosinase central domain protein n=1 Tax=Neofusicoccum parvum TaxID=310453 RepID=A0ACB5S1P3_9PEZI|nr:tyrosinase central domain protein [Neofusicoccum parvum]
MSAEDRISYTNAVQCLQSKPARTPSELAPGAKSHFDDWIVAHINQTFFVHYTATFLSWHRWYIWEYEQALRNECGYTGYQPYWDWTKTAETGLETSPIFDGSATSLGGNGEHEPETGDVVISVGDNPVYLAPGTGGGCVKSGPFSNYTVNLGPLSLSLLNGSSIGSSLTPTKGDDYLWNPRCLKRDLSDSVNKRHANLTGVLNVLRKPQNVYDFQMTLQAYPGSGEIGVHGGGHYSIGGDPGRDFFVSPGDPAFYLHHGMVDRTWWMWQMQNPAERTKGAKALMGTGTFLNDPPSANVTYEDEMNLGFVTDKTIKVKDVMSTTGGPFCYVYA